MIAAEDNPRFIPTFFRRDITDKPDKSLRRHPGIAAEMVHLIAGCFYQHLTAVTRGAT
jgi:hypothetical protein